MNLSKTPEDLQSEFHQLVEHAKATKSRTIAIKLLIVAVYLMFHILDKVTWLQNATLDASDPFHGRRDDGRL